MRTTADGEFHGGSLDVRVYSPDGLMLADPGPLHAVSAAQASSDPAVQARVDSFFTTLKSTFELERGYGSMPQKVVNVSAVPETAYLVVHAPASSGSTRTIPGRSSHEVAR